jgi:hypothetical protein
MAIIFKISDPKSLLSGFIVAINKPSGEKGSITTWEIDTDGNFTHTSKEWAKKLWFKAKIDSTGKFLIFTTVPSKKNTISVLDYGYYHGHFIETFLNHFDKEFTSVEASALPSNGDLVKSA